LHSIIIDQVVLVRMPWSSRVIYSSKIILLFKGHEQIRKQRAQEKIKMLLGSQI
jgi:hypothetical protein